MKNKKEDKWVLDGAYEITNDENGKPVKTEDVTEKVKVADKINNTRLFAPFRNQKELDDRLKDLFNKIPKKHKADLWLWIGQYESTLAEGFSNE